MKFVTATVIVCMIAFSESVSQEHISEQLSGTLEWGDGSIMLKDGNEIRGMVRYNEKTGLVSYENGSDNRSFSARNILGFEFYDEQFAKQRFFYTLEYADEADAAPHPSFFEVLKEFGDFAVLCRIDPVEIKVKQTSSNASWDPFFNNGMTTTYNQTETIYFLTPKGEVKPYLRVIRTMVDRNLYTREKTKAKVIDEKLLKTYFVEPGYSKMMTYVKENNLDLEVKDDLIKAMAFYNESTGDK